ncbi:MBL fold metallo-hydrolase [Paenibacillus turpanensis]|uniref:MBL fold metallo-hydrolase n=1 Tax=Paenibacillus turpanensis TaxID=2689078 RepID=UPI00140BF059|nr:MBL fold metallo-hydrolase [Paenibacillus turpanensis]
MTVETNIAAGVHILQILFVNVLMVEAGAKPGSNQKDWVLIDTGLAGHSDQIIEYAEKNFGCPPRAILLTHGHFDHVGDIEKLLKRWDVPVHAYESETPYLTGKADYPPGDPTAGGGMMSLLSPFYPNEAINLGNRVHSLPADGSVPHLPAWKWVHTPGHTPGHVSFFREQDRVLISGDAVITVNQESAFDVLLQREEVSGPPAYFTTNWAAAKQSARTIFELAPSVIYPGHGHPMSGDRLLQGLHSLVERFEEVAVPKDGRFTDTLVGAKSEHEVRIP